MMNANAFVVDRLRNGKQDFYPRYFESSEDFKNAMAYIDDLEANGVVKIIETWHESNLGPHGVSCVVVGMTERGSAWLLTQT